MAVEHPLQKRQSKFLGVRPLLDSFVFVTANLFKLFPALLVLFLMASILDWVNRTVPSLVTFGSMVPPKQALDSTSFRLLTRVIEAVDMGVLVVFFSGAQRIALVGLRKRPMKFADLFSGFEDFLQLFVLGLLYGFAFGALPYIALPTRTAQVAIDWAWFLIVVSSFAIVPLLLLEKRMTLNEALLEGLRRLGFTNIFFTMLEFAILFELLWLGLTAAWWISPIVSMIAVLFVAPTLFVLGPAIYLRLYPETVTVGQAEPLV